MSYVDLDRGMLPTSGSDSLGVSGAEGVSAEPVGKEKKKVGRPISFRGDINSKDLTEAERRRIKRWATTRMTVNLQVTPPRCPLCTCNNGISGSQCAFLSLPCSSLSADA